MHLGGLVFNEDVLRFEVAADDGTSLAAIAHATVEELEGPHHLARHIPHEITLEMLF